MRALVKVNATLHVGRVREDGYHPVSSVCVFPDIGDEVRLGEPADAFSLTVTGPEADGLADLPAGKNLVLRAAEALAAETELTPRRIHLEKRVPAAAGIAGGTADAAATLALLNREAAAPLSDVDLVALSRRLGADGPVCTAARLAGGGVWLAEGDGDRVRCLAGPPPLWAVLVNDRKPVPTGQVFAGFDRSRRTLPLAQPSARTGTVRGLTEFCMQGRNDLRASALTLAPGVADLEAKLNATSGCLFARMSGSGGTVFGLFASPVTAKAAASVCRAKGLWSDSGRLL